MQLRLIEESKIHCAKEHFKAISGGNVFEHTLILYQLPDSFEVWQLFLHAKEAFYKIFAIDIHDKS